MAGLILPTADAFGQGGNRHFRSQILPPYMRRSPKVAEVLPILHLRGLSTGDFKEGLAALLGEEAAGLSPTAISRLTAAWQTDYDAFQKRDLSDRDYVYVRPTGSLSHRPEEDRLCALLEIGVRPGGTKELIAVQDGYRDSTESWAAMLRGLRRRGLRAPVLAVGDGARGSPPGCRIRPSAWRIGVDELPGNRREGPGLPGTQRARLAPRPPA